jgi:hypothetical protein
LLLLLSHDLLPAQTTPAPANVGAALIIKLLSFEENISSMEKGISVYVLGSPDMESEMRTCLGKTIGTASIKTVSGGDSMPETPPKILVVGQGANINEAIAYTRAKSILSATNIPEFVKKGVTLGIGKGADKKPVILLNLRSANKEKCEWNPAIMKIAEIIK